LQRENWVQTKLPQIPLFIRRGTVQKTTATFDKVGVNNYTGIIGFSSPNPKIPLLKERDSIKKQQQPSFDRVRLNNCKGKTGFKTDYHKSLSLRRGTAKKKNIYEL